MRRHPVAEKSASLPNRPEQRQKLLHVISSYDHPARTFRRMVTQAFVHCFRILLNQLPAQRVHSCASPSSRASHEPAVTASSTTSTQEPRPCILKLITRRPHPLRTSRTRLVHSGEVFFHPPSQLLPAYSKVAAS